MSREVLKVERRTLRGKEASHKLRAKNLCLGVIYGTGLLEFMQAGEESIALVIPQHDTEVFLSHRSQELFYLELEGQEIPVILKAVQRDPVTKKIIHIDFYNLDLTKPIKYNVSIKFIGTPIGVRNDGGLLDQVMRHLSIRCLPEDIPQTLPVDVTELRLAHGIHVKDLQYDKIELLDPPNRTVATVITTRKTVAAVAATTQAGTTQEKTQ
jgi:large subunit ribosomal protein L25